MRECSWVTLGPVDSKPVELQHALWSDKQVTLRRQFFILRARYFNPSVPCEDEFSYGAVDTSLLRDDIYVYVRDTSGYRRFVGGQ